MSRRDAPIPLTARCVPNPSLDHGMVLEHDSFGQEFNSYRRGHPREDTLVIPLQNVRLARSHVTH